ncbi:MAG TPA: hypothetical protein VGC01_11710 [Mucilaginibacter sp.]
MLNRITALFLLFSLVTANFSRYMVYAGFELNKNYIAANLCENRDKPWLHCNGKCYFMKKIKQAEENDKKQTAKDNLTRLEVSFFQEPYDLSFLQPANLNNVQASCPAYSYQYSSQYINSIFRPPKSVA